MNLSFFKRSLTAITLLAFFVILSTGLKAAESNPLKIQQFKLSNGLTVILNEDNSKPEVFGLVIVKAGGKNDPSNATGMAHYMEHMLFKGTTSLGTIDWEKEKPHIERIFELYDELGKTTDEVKRTEIQTKINDESLKAAEFAIPNELSDIINEQGGTKLNAGTGPDYTMYYNMFPSNQIEKWIDLYSHRFIDPVFRSFQAELEVVYEEKNLYNDQFQTKLLESFQKEFFKNHPYGQQTLIGSIENLKNPSLTKMYEFFKTYYVANNMALVLSGDFNSDELIPIIEEKFGNWQQGEVPQQKTWEEMPFNGRELVKTRLTPIKVSLLGFRAPSSIDSDYASAEVLTSLLNNSYSTGLLDKLSLDGKLLVAQAISMPYQDHGAVIIFTVPKIVGQSFDKAEALVLQEIEKIKKGEFDDWMLDAIKQEMYRSHTTNMENIQNRALFMGTAFAKGENMEVAFDYPNKVMGVTKADVVAMANKIFGSNYIAFQSKTGFPKKEKIEKPNYKPLLANKNAKSEYAKHLETVPALEPKFKPIDFNTDIQRASIATGHELLRVQNPDNDIFSFTLSFEVGEYEFPMLKYASAGLNMSGAGEYNVNALKEEFAKIGTSYNIYTNDSYTVIDLQGIEANLPRTLELVGLLISNPKLEQAKIKNIIDGDLTSRKMERSEPDNVAQALLSFGLYGKKSEYIDRLSKKQLKALQATELVDAFKKATGYTSQILYSGTISADEVAKLVNQYIPLAASPVQGTSPIDKVATLYTENTVFFVDKPKARQSKVFLFMNGSPFSIENAVAIEAFNDYFGGGFSGLILQEIREYRSLAYSAGGNFRLPNLKGSPVNFIGYVGTQSDKTLTAMETFNGLFRSMPEKSERVEMIKNHLELSSQTGRPSFRGLANSVERWKRLGYSSDPALYKQAAYKNLEWNTIAQFYSNEVKNKPLVYIIVGDKKQIDMNAIQIYGKVVEIKEAELFTE
jgi:predicted Zn-dependent peptidase